MQLARFRIIIKTMEEKQMEKNNIVLIGMPTSGKSTVGVLIAKILGMDFLDTDIVIQQRENAKLNEIIAEHGIDEFIKKEEQAILSVSASNAVIATGGSAVYSDVAMKYLAEKSTIIYLNVKLEDLNKRLKNIKERGVVLRPGESIEDMYEHRKKLYEKYADITVEETGASIEDTVLLVMNSLKNSFGER